uniref:Uncharacterized protein n=1 Tax=Picea glauca TaxID=3330 RepID=A0A101LYC2_PICGL|nr:hypothetical protein ABT39_MTgene5775 [Picea glauca]QHR90452.1 hypothetical protein Q903MT_gene4476 [Picea sitchensis]
MQPSKLHLELLMVQRVMMFKGLPSKEANSHPMKTGRGICLVGECISSLIRPTQLEMLFSLPQPGLTQGPTCKVECP